jgi:DNA-nicking Smr family endonuclease
MAAGDSGSDSFRDLFEEAMRDVQPIESRPVAPPPHQPRRAKRPTGDRTPPLRPTRFEIEELGERIEGRVPGFDLRRLVQLKRGEIAPEATVDLHGALEADARLAVRDALRDARAAGIRCLLVIHGRGLHSPDGPVLKKALPLWLAEPPVGAWILAFASAPPSLGGPGATLVLLRKSLRRDG